MRWRPLADRLLYLVNGQQEFLGTQEEFRAYVKRKTQGEGWREDMSLEKMYLLISPKTKCGDHGGDIMKKLLAVFRIEGIAVPERFLWFLFTFVFLS